MPEIHTQKGNRREDLRLITGRGHYTSDWNLPGQLHAAFLRSDHAHAEIVSINAAAALKRAHDAGGRIAAIGTTALRTLESAADEKGRIHAFAGDTSIFITPGYRFRAVDLLVTNFHLPCSTLFMLVCAFMGLETMRHAYAEAIREKYRFYSYGDACLLIRPS